MKKTACMGGSWFFLSFFQLQSGVQEKRENLFQSKVNLCDVKLSRVVKEKQESKEDRKAYPAVSK